MEKKNVVSVKLDLSKFKHSFDEKGNIVLDIEANHFVHGKKGSVYVDLDMHSSISNERGNKRTHLLTQRLPKDIYEAMTVKQANNMPLLGNALDYDKFREMYPDAFKKQETAQEQTQVQNQEQGISR